MYAFQGLLLQCRCGYFQWYNVTCDPKVKQQMISGSSSAISLAFSSSCSSFNQQTYKFVAKVSTISLGWFCMAVILLGPYEVSALRNNEMAAFQGFWLYITQWRCIPDQAKCQYYCRCPHFRGGGVPLYIPHTINGGKTWYQLLRPISLHICVSQSECGKNGCCFQISLNMKH